MAGAGQAMYPSPRGHLRLSLAANEVDHTSYCVLHRVRGRHGWKLAQLGDYLNGRGEIRLECAERVGELRLGPLVLAQATRTLQPDQRSCSRASEREGPC